MLLAKYLIFVTAPISMFRVKSDVKYKPIPSKLECLHNHVWWVYCSVWSTMMIIIILSAVLGVARHLKANYSILCKSQQKYVSFWKGMSFLMTFSTYYTTLHSNCIGPVCKHVASCVLVLSREMIHFYDDLIDVTLVYVLPTFE